MIKQKIDKFRYGKIINNIIREEYIEFKDVNDAEKWGKTHYRNWSEEYKSNMNITKKVITDSENTSVIESYCGYGYREINEYLRFSRDNEHNYAKNMATTLAVMLSMAPRVPNNVVAYRLVCDEFIRRLIENNRKEIPTIEKGFISTSLVKDIINSDEVYSKHNNLLKIYIPQDTVGIYVNEIAKRTEQELLLFPNGYFRLIRNPYNEGNKMVYECELFYFDF